MEQAQERLSRETAGGAKAPDRWYLHVQGRTVGPLAGEEVAFGLKTGEFLPSDKIANSRHPIWRRVAEHPVFGKLAAAGAVPRSKLLQAPPPPRLLRVKPMVPTIIPEFVPARPAVENPVEAAEAHSISPAAPAVEAAPAPLPEKAPEIALPKETSLSPSFAQVKVAALEPDLEDPETNAALEAATRELERVLSSLRKPEPLPEMNSPRTEKAELKGIPSRPEVQPIFLAEPAARKVLPESHVVPAAKGVIRIELKLPESPRRWLLLLALLMGAAWYFGLFSKKAATPSASPAPSIADPAPAASPSPAVEAEPVLRPGEQVITGEASAARPLKAKKTRDLKEFPLSDPSSPTNTPSDTGDPVPRLKAPVRPQRD